MDKATGKQVTVNGKVLKATSGPFTVQKPNGSVDISLSFNASDVKHADYVMFERIYELATDKDSNQMKEVLVGRHEDIKDKSQTVTIPAAPRKHFSGSPKSVRRRVQTGEFPVMPLAGACAVLALLAGLYIIKTRKKGKDE